ncbi:hypothetical protein ACWGI0_15435 [Streptomyces sp. NPDC054802]
MNQLGDKPEEVRKRLEEEKNEKGRSGPGDERAGDTAERADESGEPRIAEAESPGNEDQSPL